ncbi:regulatory signaling modulator protein AmpE [Pseudomonas sp. KNUC1026]|uniref:regulatory signaling modulator protein AmpE n=1 Tax=Pseudomonas sp. KNUC1026 TaxID=2893890 RepID=UPI001F1AAE13|nr:regulatory signaling modulator protein AmpE [Pseudomonas sp. KNUC1026]UFH48771.1 regulatory signaling modulator protein AmpE [Pseudomonas sp. KNUC1026]
MTFLVLLVIVWVEKFSALRQRLQRDGFLLGELARLERVPALARDPWLILLILAGVPMAVLGLLLVVIKPVGYGLLALPVHLLVLGYSLGRGDPKAALGPLRDAWRRGDDTAALHVAERDIGVGAETPAQLVGEVQGWLLWRALESFFSVVFWYALLGPVMVLGYRLVALVAEHSRHAPLVERAAQLRHALDWLPARLLGASFALVGNFIAVMRLMLQELLHWYIGARELVGQAGQLATGASPEQPVEGLDALWSLLQRAAVLWYVVLAVATLLN